MIFRNDKTCGDGETCLITPRVKCKCEKRFTSKENTRSNKTPEAHCM